MFRPSCFCTVVSSTFQLCTGFEFVEFVEFVVLINNGIARAFGFWNQPKIFAPVAFQINRSTAESPAGSQTSSIKRIFKFKAGFILEVVAVFFVLAALSATIPPDINESHYLTKAKHFWNPNWCRGDLFLESADAHLVFYCTCGWPTQFLSLSVFAWCGRIACWAGFALSWVYLNRVLAVRRWMSVVSAALLVLLSNRFDMAGEWVVGGFEGKSIAYVFVVWAIGLFIERRCSWFWPVIGLACAFHAIVGVWALVCFAGSAIAQLLLQPGRNKVGGKFKFSKPVVIGLAAFCGFLALGAVPPIAANWGVEAEVAKTASYVQVQERLRHHQLFDDFSSAHVGRFLVLVVAWLFVIRMFYSDLQQRRLEWFCTSSLLVSLCGVLLSGCSGQDLPYSEGANSLLRYYWFRFSDFAIPLGLSLTCARFAGGLVSDRSLAKRRWYLFSAVCLALAVVAAVVETKHDLRAPADKASLTTYVGDDARTTATHENWLKVCEWVRTNTKPDSVFIAPVEHQTFNWHAERAQVACWKDMPQDSVSVVEWRSRIGQLRGVEAHSAAGYLALTDEQTKYLVDQFAATHLLIPQVMEDFAKAEGIEIPERLTRVYPEDSERSTFVVFEISIAGAQEE